MEVGRERVLMKRFVQLPKTLCNRYGVVVSGARSGKILP